MVEGEGYTHNFYAGADYGFDSKYGQEFAIKMDKAYSAGSFGLTTDPRSANQLGAVSNKLNTGAKVIEVTAIQPQILESIPNQHLDELNRLRKLAGVDLTFHGPILEPSGFTRQGWDEGQREQIEKQMWSAVQRSHRIDPDGNVVVTFHSGAVGVNPETRVFTEVLDPTTGKKEKKEVIKEVFVMDEGTGQASRIEMTPNYFMGTDKNKIGDLNEQRKIVEQKIEEKNKEVWSKQLQGVSYHAFQGRGIINGVLAKTYGVDEDGEVKAPKEVYELYKMFSEGKDYSEAVKKLKIAPDFEEMVHGDLYLRDSYVDLQKLYNSAYETALRNDAKEDLAKLEKFREELLPNLKKIEDRENVGEFGDVIIKGVEVLNSLSGPPKTLKTFREFTRDKSSDTFSNIAFNAYSEFKNSAPIISIENPPAGDAPIYRADDLKDLIVDSRKKLTNRLIAQKGLSESEAKAQAEKLIGATWDVGHINMIRKFGFEGKHLEGESKTIAPFVKHVHLSDNFGMDHTELPMGMGNVPTNDMLKHLKKDVKKIVETGNWFEPFKFSPLRETFRAFGSPVYGMSAGPSWNQVASSSGGYFAGYGRTLPDQHFSLYGAGFSTLPPELGGQMAGRSRASGAPID